MSLIPSPSFENDLLYLDNLLFPRNDFRPLSTMKRLLPRVASNQHDMRLDMKETDTSYELNVDLPGFDKSKLDVSIDTNNLLTISAERSEVKNEANSRYHFTERTFGSHTRTIQLPKDIDSSNLEAKYENGVLGIHIPKDSRILGTKSVTIH